MAISSIISTTKGNLARNKWMAIASVIVIGIVFTISTLFISVELLSQQAITYLEKKAQVVVYFKPGTKVETINTVKDKVNLPGKIENILYISEEDAVNIYRKDFDFAPDLVDSVTTGTLPSSLEIRANTVQNLVEVKEILLEEKKTNAAIDDITFSQDVLDKLQVISSLINIGGTILVIGLLIITFTLIAITIGFNIQAHKDEIEIMHLVGSSDRFIKAPFILEGALYGFLGGVISCIFTVVPIIVAFTSTNGSYINFSISQQLSKLNLSFIANLDPVFFGVFILIQLTAGILIGSFGSSMAVFKYLNLKEK